ncbi:hypothetical protein GJ496_000534 [Pomphorhynchus laevis]|nr:hypothetical protein GJ496_000534 [Pomphorhynchus laevis]
MKGINQALSTNRHIQIRSGKCAVCKGLFRLNRSDCLQRHEPVAKRCRGSGRPPWSSRQHPSSTDHSSSLSIRADRVLSSSRIADSNARPFDLLRCVWILPANTLKCIPWNMCRRSANVFASLLFQDVISNSYRDYERLLCFQSFAFNPCNHVVKLA